MIDLYPLVRPLFFALDPEKAHHLTLRLMKLGVTPHVKNAANPMLETQLFGNTFPNPVGLSAGFDKNAEVIGASFGMGFGFVEAGTVTPLPQDGNPKPRIFRDPENGAVINRMGFPNGGLAVFKKNLQAFLARVPADQRGMVGINIGMNKTQTEPAKDYCALIDALAPMADYLTINISSPNTPGLRDLQRREPLLELLGAVKEARTKACNKGDEPPILLKLAPDLDDAQMAELAAAVVESQIEGLILTNTTLDRPAHLTPDFAAEKGGLSGQPLTDKSTAVIRNFYELTQGRVPIIGVGGISNGEQAYAKICAGASMVQLYSALVFGGPSVVLCILNQLQECLERDGYDHISQAVGSKSNLKKGAA